MRSEAVGVVVLKPLARALADGDRVRAVILGSAVNNDGFTGAGMAAPHAGAKAELMRAACAAAGVEPADLDFIEAHGTGTLTGDAAELQALADVMAGRDGRPPCVVGSAKVNLGHSEGAAGVVGLIKSVLSLERRAVPALPFLEVPTSAVDWGRVPLRLPRERVELPPVGRLLAGINSFGATGTNAHVVLATAPEHVAATPDPGPEAPCLLALSARSAESLRTLAERYGELLSAPGAPPLREVCAAAATRRSHYEYRLAVAGRTAVEVAAALDVFAHGQDHPGVAASEGPASARPRIVFVFSGQGAQWSGMGRELLAGGGVFAETLRECDEVIREYGGFSLLEHLADDDEAWLERTAVVCSPRCGRWVPRWPRSGGRGASSRTP
ncbi:acyltransferase domain-containing protein [Streptomyces sp. NPDC048650]|uniref:acyltransferase domain-containing protein n=1 Tax=Streptomyces sp. NPDC048650 TaxID=3365583 RepID=UPI0037197B1A